MSFKTRIDKFIFEQSKEFAIDSQFKTAITTFNSQVDNRQIFSNDQNRSEQNFNATTIETKQHARNLQAFEVYRN